MAVLGRDREDADGRELVALEPMVEMRCVSFRGPSPFDGWGEGKATLIEEDEVGAQAFGLFLYAARRGVSNRRWLARCAGGPGALASDSSTPAHAGVPRWSEDDRPPSTAGESPRRPAGWSTGRCGTPQPGDLSAVGARGVAVGAGRALEDGPESVSGRGSWGLPADRRRPTGRSNSASIRVARPQPTGSGPSCAARWRVGDAAPADWGCHGVSWLIV